MFLFLALGLSGAGCAKDVVAPNEDTVMTREGMAALDGLRKAYQDRSAEDMRAFTTPGGFEEVSSGLPEFERAELEFRPKWVEIDAAKVVTFTVSWKGSWWGLPGEEQEAERTGIAVFRMTGRPLKIDAILSGSPFVPPARDF